MSLVLSLLCLWTTTASALSFLDNLPERRKDQFNQSAGHYILPMPYSLPGIGEGLGVAGAAINMINHETDVIGFYLTGDITGFGLAITDIALSPQSLYLDITAQQMGSISTQNYQNRGFNSDAEKYSLINIADLSFIGLRLTSTHYERRIEFYSALYTNKGTLDSIRDNQGNLIQQTDTDFGPNEAIGLGARIDLTDDYDDPREGIRFSSDVFFTPTKESGTVDQYTFDNNLSIYLPMGKQSTWLLNYYTSDAIVKNQGATDRITVMSDLGVDCDALASGSDRDDCNGYVNNQIAANQYGTASGIGGRNHLRSFPEDRFKAAHVRFIGTEFRWNLTEEFTPFNWGIMKDIRTQVQLAFFYELATIADDQKNLWDDTRYSLGTGVRMVTASGLVIRGDIATGKEGQEVTVIIGYPWEGF
jgi:outer membrane protein assembly factor BamA